MDKSKNCAEPLGGSNGEELGADELSGMVASAQAAGALPAADAGVARKAGVLGAAAPAAGPHIGVMCNGGGLVWLDTGRDRGLDLNRGEPQAEGVGTEPDGRVSEAAPIKNSRGVEQPAARVAHNHKVDGSSPSSATSHSIVAIDAPPGAADAGPDTARTADPSLDLPPWPWPCSPPVAPAPRGLFPHQRFG